MSFRVFISFRGSDGADKAAALARDLDAMFGDDQIFLDRGDLAPESLWRDGIAAASGNAPILLVLVTPDYLGAVDAQGRRCIDRADDPVRNELETGTGARAHIIPLLCDGVESLPSATELPSPFDHLCELQWGRLRAGGWRADMGRLADDLCELGLTPRPASMAESIPVPMNEPTTTPMPLDSPADGGHREVVADEGRRSLFGVATFAVLAVGGWAFWRWRQKRAAMLSGPWHTRIGSRGAPTSTEVDPVTVTLQQDGENLRLASGPVDIGRNPDWENYRDFWKQRTGLELNRIFYRGEGEIVHDNDELAASPATAVQANAASASASTSAADADGASEDASSAPQRKRKFEPARKPEPVRPVGLRRVVIDVRIATPGTDSETIDEGVFRGVVDTDDQWIRGRLWLKSEQAERVMDLRR